MFNEYRRIEEITGDAVRIRGPEQKPRLIVESIEPGEKVSTAARRRGVATNRFTDGAGFSAKEGQRRDSGRGFW